MSQPGQRPYRVCNARSGNICRSPTAEVVFRAMVAEAGLEQEVETDSAGTGDWHVGQGADARSLTTLTGGGYDGSAHRARQFESGWFDGRDLVIALNRGHQRKLRSLAPDPPARDKVRLLRSFDPSLAGTQAADHGDAAGPLPLEHRTSQRPPFPHWRAFFAELRLAPYVFGWPGTPATSPLTTPTLSTGWSTISQLVHQGLTGQAEAPSRLHGDLWSGSVMWTAAGAVLIDPAAHGGHRESDLAVLPCSACRAWSTFSPDQGAGISCLPASGTNHRDRAGRSWRDGRPAPATEELTMRDTGDRTSGGLGVEAGGQRPLGRSDVSVSVLGLGTAPLGGLFRHVEAEDALAVVRRALEVGLTYLDTAPQYGHGTAERRLGEALVGVPRSSYVLSTKVGRLVVERPDGDTGLFQDAPPSDVVFDFSRSGVLRSLEASLDRLGLDRVDVAYIHDPDDYETQALDEAYPALEELRDEGVVGAIGVGMNVSRMPTRFVRETDVDAVLLAGRYTLLDQSGAVDLLPAAAEKGVSIVIGGVYNSGILADPRPGATYDYADAAPEVVRRAQRIAEVCRRHDVPITAAAIQFPFAQPTVACVLTGSRDVRELEENRAALARQIPAALWQDLVSDGLLPAEHAPAAGDGG